MDYIETIIKNQFAAKVQESMDPTSSMSVAERAKTIREFFNAANRIKKKQTEKNASLQLELAEYKRRVQDGELVPRYTVDQLKTSLRATRIIKDREIDNLKRKIEQLEEDVPKKRMRIIEVPEVPMDRDTTAFLAMLPR